MHASRVRRQSWLTFCLYLVAASAFAQAQPATQPFEPQVGQAGKDVVWVPTADSLVQEMLNLANVTPQDLVMDLGSGDGRTVIAAAKRGATAIGVEFNPDMVALSRKNAAAQGMAARATFIEGDLFKADLTKATVITMFLLPDINLKLRPHLLDLRPGTRIVSNTFTMGDWEPDARYRVEGAACTSWCEALFWVIPAKVGGTWKMAQGDLVLEQAFQHVNGILGTQPIAEGTLRGTEITFTVGASQYHGRVNGNTIQGTVASGARTSNWSATRVG
jgi:SAM-dependent methyltransferase